MYAGMPLNLPQSLVASAYAVDGKSLMSPRHAYSSFGAGREAAAVGRSAIAVAVRKHQVKHVERNAVRAQISHHVDIVVREGICTVNTHLLTPQAVSVKPGGSGGEVPAKKRRVLFPSVPRAAACGACPACLNPGWKQACQTRRLEAAAQAAGADLFLPAFYICLSG